MVQKKVQPTQRPSTEPLSHSMATHPFDGCAVCFRLYKSKEPSTGEKALDRRALCAM
jgi:hypothetical protein